MVYGITQTWTIVGQLESSFCFCSLFLFIIMLFWFINLNQLSISNTFNFNSNFLLFVTYLLDFRKKPSEIWIRNMNITFCHLKGSRATKQISDWDTKDQIWIHMNNSTGWGRRRTTNYIFFSFSGFLFLFLTAAQDLTQSHVENNF